MGLFQSKEEALKESLREERAYAVASQEIASGELRSGLWAKAVTEAKEDLRRAQTIYIKLRVEQVLLEFAVATNEAERVARLPKPKYYCTKCKGTDISGWLPATCNTCKDGFWVERT